MTYNKIDKKRAKASYRDAEWMHGHAIMCPHCYSLTTIAEWNPETGNHILIETNFKCWSCEKSMLADSEDTTNLDNDLWPIRVDEAIAFEIATLNILGFKTIACCSGHIGDPHCYVYFHPVWLMGDHKVSKVGDIIRTVESDKRLSYYIEIDTNCLDGHVVLRLNSKKIKAKYKNDPYYHVNLFRGLLKRLISCLKKRLNIPEKVLGIRRAMI